MGLSPNQRQCRSLKADDYRTSAAREAEEFDGAFGQNEPVMTTGQSICAIVVWVVLAGVLAAGLIALAFSSSKGGQ